MGKARERNMSRKSFVHSTVLNKGLSRGWALC